MNSDLKSKLSRWESFKTDLPHQKEPYTKRNWGNSLHSLCSYQGKMKPSLAYHLVEVFSNPGDRVLDPFSGSGTIPFEAALNGRTSFGIDISTVSYALSQGKLRTPDESKINILLQQLKEYIDVSQPNPIDRENAKLVKFNGYIDSYFHPKTYNEILIARRFFKERKDSSSEWALVFAAMLHILHGNRPYALSRRSHPITPFSPTGEFEYKSLCEKLTNKVNKSLSTDRGDTFTQGICYEQDILNEWPTELDNLDLIITSPPFFDSTRFYMANWMRFWFSGWEKIDFKIEPDNYIEKKQKHNLDIYSKLFTTAKNRLKPGGLFVLHLGASKKCNMGEELGKIAAQTLEVIDCFDESVAHCQRHGVRDQGTVTGHQYLVLRN